MAVMKANNNTKKTQFSFLLIFHWDEGNNNNEVKANEKKSGKVRIYFNYVALTGYYAVLHVVIKI